MILKIKAFIYRFSLIFGLRIYLADKEEKAYKKTLKSKSKISRGALIGLWQAKYGFTSIWTYKMPFHKATIARIKHAFTFRSWK